MNPIDQLVSNIELQRDRDNLVKGLALGITVGVLMSAILLYTAQTAWLWYTF